MAKTRLPASSLLALRHINKPWKACLQNATPISKALLYNTLSPPSIDKAYTQHTSPPTSTRTTSNNHHHTGAKKDSLLPQHAFILYCAEIPPLLLEPNSAIRMWRKNGTNSFSSFPTAKFPATALCSCSLPFFSFFLAMGLSIVFGGNEGARGIEGDGEKSDFLLYLGFLFFFFLGGAVLS
jgi:hypothetical protein